MTGEERYFIEKELASPKSIDSILPRVQGEELANLVADQLIYSSIRTDQDTQRLSVPTRIGVRHPKLSSVIQMMESRI